MPRKNQHAVALGKRGAHKGGKARAELPQSQLSELGQRAIAVRWAKRDIAEKLQKEQIAAAVDWDREQKTFLVSGDDARRALAACRNIASDRGLDIRIVPAAA